MTSPAKLNEYNHAERPALDLLEQLGWTCVPRDALAAELGDEREVLLKRSNGSSIEVPPNHDAHPILFAT